MSARIHQLLAQELDISDERAQKLLRAMMHEVKKRADRGGGIRIPDLGSFQMEDGELTFSPSDSLARAVNHRYEGLADEDLSTADRRSSEEREGPSTISTGFQSALAGGSSSSSSSSSGADTDEFEVGGSSGDPGDTAEFQVDESEDAAGASTDAEASKDVDSPSAQPSASPPSSPDSPSQPPAFEDSPSQDTASQDSTARDPHPATSEPPADERATEDYRARKEAHDEAGTSDSDAETSPESGPSFYDVADQSQRSEEASAPSESASQDAPTPSSSSSQDADAPSPDPSPDPSRVEDAGDTARAEDPKEEGDYDNTGSIWDADNPWELSQASMSDEDSGEDLSADSAFAEEGFSLDDEDDAEDTDSASVSESKKAPASASASKPKASPKPEASPTSSAPANDGARKGSSAARVFVGLVIVLLLGATGWFLAGKRGMVSPPQQVFAQLTQGLNSSASSSSPTSSAGPADGSDAASSGSSTNSSTSSSSSESSAASTDASGSSSSAASGFVAGNGNWTIAVASRDDRNAAQTLVNSYRDRLSSDSVPVDIVTGVVNGQERYRVGVGQYTSSDDARAAMDRYSDVIPPGAWPVQIDGS